MKYTKWVGRRLNDLALPWEQFTLLYPHIKKNNYSQLRRYHNIIGEYRMPPASPERQPEGGRLAKTWEAAAYDKEQGEWVHTELHSYEHVPTQEELIELWQPVEPAKVTPTRRKQIKRMSKFVLAYGDGQVGYRRIIDPVTDEQTLVPTHNVPMHNIIQQLNAEIMPETTVNLGDFADFPEFSDFPPDSDHYHKTLARSMRWIHDFYAQLVADNPKGRHVEVDSNHATRVKKQILKKMPYLHDFVLPGEEYPMMSYYRLANLGELGIEFISGYGAAEFVYGEDYDAPAMVFKHGTHSSSAPGTTVRKEAQQNPSVHVIRGHGHNHEHIMTTTRDGHQLHYLQVGSSCQNNGPVPGYHSAINDRNEPVKIHQNHQNTIVLIEDFQNGTYNIYTINVIDGKAYFNGKEYNGNIQ